MIPQHLKKFLGHRPIYRRWSLKKIFCFNTIFNLSKKILTEAEIKVLEIEKGLDFAPIQKTLNEPELRKDFEEFYYTS